MTTKKLYVNPLTKMTDNETKINIRLDNNTFSKLKEKVNTLQDKIEIPCSKKLISTQKVIETLIRGYVDGEIDVVPMRITARK